MQTSNNGSFESLMERFNMEKNVATAATARLRLRGGLSISVLL